MFTKDQKTRMMSILNNTNSSYGVAHLSSASNLVATGVANPYGPVVCVPIPDFNYNKEMICEGDSVVFTDIFLPSVLYAINLRANYSHVAHYSIPFSLMKIKRENFE